MRISKRFHLLKTRISELENIILPNERLNGDYSAKEIDLIKSYLLLVHAEIEAYFEDIAREKITATLQDWRRNRRKSSCLKSILAYSGNEVDYSNQRQEDSFNIEFRMNRAVTHFLSTLNRNNGIKRIDLLKILIPIGLELSDIDQVWLNTMESFGSLRGSVAHSSFSRVSTILDRNTIRESVVNHILPEIEKLDIKIKNLK